MEYHEEDRWLFGPDYVGTTLGQKICAAIIFAAVIATGFVEHETVSVMQETESKPLLCPRYDADGRELRSSMVMESYVKNAMKKHECEYQYRSRG